MNIIETLLSSAGGDGIVKQLAGQFGIDADQATSAVSTLVPALAGGLKEKLESGGASGLTELINGGSLTRFAEDPSALAGPAAVDAGKSLLNMIFGGGDTSNLVSMVAEKTGIGGGVINTMLPIITTLLGGFLSKNAASGSGTDLTSLLGMLSGNSEGILGAVKGLASKIFG